jgi:hypothetical protein
MGLDSLACEQACLNAGSCRRCARWTAPPFASGTNARCRIQADRAKNPRHIKRCRNVAVLGSRRLSGATDGVDRPRLRVKTQSTCTRRRQLWGGFWPFSESRCNGKFAQTAATPNDAAKGSSRTQTRLAPGFLLAGSLPIGRRAAQAFLVVFCVTREARHVRNPENCGDPSLGCGRL